MIFDTHSHYNDKAFDEDRDELLSSFRENGISGTICASAEMDSIPLIVELCEKYDYLYPTIGIHPNEALELDNDGRKKLEKYIETVKPVAIGEIGLDYYYEEPSKDVQREAFIYQLELAKKYDLPVIIHSREASQETYDILKSFDLPKKGVIHCYSGSAQMAVEYVKMGYYIGVGGVVTFKNGTKLKDTVKAIPLESILLETDCPYLAPVPFRGKRNSSLLLPYVVEEIASLKGIHPKQVMDVTEKNASRLFNIDIRATYS